MTSPDQSAGRRDRETTCPGMVVRSAETRPGVQTVTIQGEIDLATKPALAAAFATAAERASREIVVDLTRVDFCGSVGISALMALHRTAAERSLPLRIRPSQHVARLLELTGLAAEFPVANTGS